MAHETVPGWEVADGKLTRDVKLKNFAAALALVNAIGAAAEEANHHPDLCLHSWNHVRVELTTHSAGAITENDYVLARGINQLLSDS